MDFQLTPFKFLVWGFTLYSPTRYLHHEFTHTILKNNTKTQFRTVLNKKILSLEYDSIASISR